MMTRSNIAMGITSPGVLEGLRSAARQTLSPVPRVCMKENAFASMLPILIVALVVGGPPTLYFAVRSREFRKFSAGAFFVSAGVQFYFYLANVSIPLVGTPQVQTPELSGARSIVHFALFLITLYFGFFSNSKGRGRD